MIFIFSRILSGVSSIKKRPWKLLLLISMAIVLSSCGQWKVTSYGPDLLLQIENGTSAGQVKIKSDEFGFENLTAGVGVFDDTVCVIDNILKRVQLMGTDGEVSLVIGSTEDIDKTRVDTSFFNFSTIGSFTIDYNDNIYIQNRFQQIRSLGQRGGPDEENFSPSYILVFNKKGELQYTLGQSGSPDIPFYHIESLDADSQGRLFVITSSFDSWRIFRYIEKKRDLFINLGKLKFEDKEDGEIYKGKIDNVKVYESGDKFLISVAYYHGLRLKYLKIFDYSIEKGAIEKTIIKIPDPKNVLFNIVNDKEIYFWNITNGEVKFIICNMDGSIINNIYLKSDNDKKKYYYSKIFGNKSGDIYSYHIHKNGIEVYEWK